MDLKAIERSLLDAVRRIRQVVANPRRTRFVTEALFTETSLRGVSAKTGVRLDEMLLWLEDGRWIAEIVAEARRRAAEGLGPRSVKPVQDLLKRPNAAFEVANFGDAVVFEKRKDVRRLRMIARYEIFSLLPLEYRRGLSVVPRSAAPRRGRS